MPMPTSWPASISARSLSRSPDPVFQLHPRVIARTPSGGRGNPLCRDYGLLRRCVPRKDTFDIWADKDKMARLVHAMRRARGSPTIDNIPETIGGRTHGQQAARTPGVATLQCISRFLPPNPGPGQNHRHQIIRYEPGLSGTTLPVGYRCRTQCLRPADAGPL